MKDYCSRIRENSGHLGIAPKSHDFGYTVAPCILRMYKVSHGVARWVVRIQSRDSHPSTLFGRLGMACFLSRCSKAAFV
ncbi:MAG: hypothetical protein QGF59_15620, partial [Pirellulaceae bacterium]|nr:hypothetical protein [Pirellulaceae bacterium]